MKQTAVEWLVEQLEKHYFFQDIKNTTAFLQAKEMEKQQMFAALIKGSELNEAYDIELEFNEYYNEQFKNK
jgi:hypothetical protein